ncbi:hypothetical protein PV11_07853 [Exophiala sideris]|uniref:A to I editase domain-containing protein n=1 Tax=Exophiala sideris TaxID=1016849 RepID=A0A0D1Z044_9EURO|nr:hypothetical protein PV11_07853 [Exophiala sideris]
MTTLAQGIAHAALSTFDALPPRCKPRILEDGRREWTAMAAVVLATGEGTANLTCVSLATGTKCLAASALPKCQGLVLHDSHAEVLALRGFNYWLLREVHAILTDLAYQSPFLEAVCEPGSIHDHQQGSPNPQAPFRLKSHVSIHFFTTEAPCGDASMEILMESLPSSEAQPWPTDQATLSALQGRGHFSLLGHVRRKPARADAEPSLSKSCSDKLSVKQFTSILSFPTDLFVQRTINAHIETVVVYADKFNSTGYERAFGPSGRLSGVTGSGRFFQTQQLSAAFPRFSFERSSPSLDAKDRPKAKASNISTLWIKGSAGVSDVLEVLINGVKQGFKQWATRMSKASVVSRWKLWQLACTILTAPSRESTGNGEDAKPQMIDEAWMLAVRRSLSASSYAQAKYTSSRQDSGKTHVTDAMGNWTRNEGDDAWGLTRSPACW